jgi:SAM-dependent methyltransferase
MKAYHVDLMRAARPADVSLSRNCYSQWSADPDTLIHRRRFELLTQMYSCINHKKKNPDIPLTLITDENTLKYYDRWRLTGLYDEVITDFHDDYPRQRVSTPFWSSPKIWAMQKLKAPFVIIDTDTVIRKPLSAYADCDLLYLHRETPAVYPHPSEIAGPPGYEWDPELLDYFRGAIPMSCAVTGMFDEEFKRDYVKRYFEFVLDASGELLDSNRSVDRAHRGTAAQVLAEQWLLAALADKWNIRTRALAKVLWVYTAFRPLDMDQRSAPVNEEMTENFYRLWGAKKIQNNITDAGYDPIRTTLLGGRYIVEESPQYDIVKDVYEEIIAGLTDDNGEIQHSDDLATVFDSIYEAGEWGRDGRNEGTSGSGSSVEGSEPYCRYLRGFLKEKNIKSVVDVGCGDWQISGLIDWEGISYVGYDASKLVIEKNLKSHRRPNIRFVHDNFVTADLPGADLLIVKDVLQHLSVRNIKLALEQFHKFKYVIAVNDVDPVTLSAPNVDVRDGGYRTLDIAAEPFNVDGEKVLTYQPDNWETKQVFLIEN